MAESLSREQIESSDVYVSDVSSVINFQHPIDYLQPFLDIIEPLGGTVSFRGEVGSISKERAREDVEEQAKHTAYKRLIARAKLPDEFTMFLDLDTDFKELWSEIGFVFSLDGKNPELRAYRGKRVSICDNQCIFGADNVTSLNLLKSSTRSIYDSLRIYADNAASDLEKYKETISKLYDNKLSGGKLNERIGHIITECKKNPKLGITCGIDLVGYMLDSKSRYFPVNGQTNDWVLYNGLTESLKKSNILDEAAKTLLLERVFVNN